MYAITASLNYIVEYVQSSLIKKMLWALNSYLFFLQILTATYVTCSETYRQNVNISNDNIEHSCRCILRIIVVVETRKKRRRKQR